LLSTSTGQVSLISLRKWEIAFGKEKGLCCENVQNEYLQIFFSYLGMKTCNFSWMTLS
jgi:hypothetical protein